eukprot:TRINITY_DN15731_c0_g1_i1.p1 TRINITY_DN15731_c0_g1~~TRINITY_DN15731_c0_g1_i1.p1  ORF type:complete len:461 (-),score=128.51 TRINITY_DN15731_c0_g1_i1:49-1431(-)
MKQRGKTSSSNSNSNSNDSREGKEKGRVAVVVVGEIGRNPRMQYHALSLADHFEGVDLVGYEGPPPCPQLQSNPNVVTHHLPTSSTSTTPIAHGVGKLKYLFKAMLKALVQAFHLFIVLLRLSSPRFILLQTPPAIPTLAVVWIVCRLKGCYFVIDWHNLAFSLIRLSRGDSIFVTISRIYEQWMGKRGDLHLCVTNAMAAFLKNEWGIDGTRVIVMHDKPPPFFRKCGLEEKHNLFLRIHDLVSNKPLDKSDSSEENTVVTTRTSDGKIALRRDRPAVLVSSTSWTADEDFEMLLDALMLLENKFHITTNVLCLITGKGPMKQYYEEKISQLTLKKIQIKTLWLAAEDYPKLLGCADVGVSLHSSSSNLDLPMKVVDMFGCKLPVCALGFECLDELVQHQNNGLVFQDREELAEHLNSLLSSFHLGDTQLLDKLQKNIELGSWNDEWDRCVFPHFRSLV